MKTNKEIFDDLKLKAKTFKNKIKMVNMLKSNINRKLRYSKLSEEEYADTLAKLKDVEINEMRLRRNKFQSKSYEFKPVFKKQFGYE